jgi:hypothetical protein
MWTTVFGAVALFAGCFAVAAYLMREQDKRNAVGHQSSKLKNELPSAAPAANSHETVIPMRGDISLG